MRDSLCLTGRERTVRATPIEGFFALSAKLIMRFRFLEFRKRKNHGHERVIGFRERSVIWAGSH